MKVIRKVETFEAVQYKDKETPLHIFLKKWNHYEQWPNKFVGDFGYALKLTDLKNDILVLELGDWLLLGDLGTMLSLRDHEFKKLYESIDTIKSVQT